MYDHPVLSFHRGKRVRFYFEDKIVEAYEGESIAVALHAIGVDVFSWSPVLRRPRGPFCMIGKCSSCFMTVNGYPNSKTCRIPVRDGLRVERQKGWGLLADLNNSSESIEVEELNPDILVIGGGPAGLEAALTASTYGLDVVLVDEHFKLGGQLLKQTHKFFGNVELFGGMRGFQIAEKYAEKIGKSSNIKTLLNTVAYGVFREGIIGAVSENKHYVIKPRAVIIASGAQEKFLDFPNNDLPGVIGAGGAQTLMNEFGVKPGEEALVVGSGNVGLIISYQLLQSGIKVKGVVEVMSEIGGWFVHAAKIRRYGIPIYVKHTLKHVEGEQRVSKAVIAAVDEKLNFIPGTEKEFSVDLVLLAVGLEPDTRLHAQAGATMKYTPELGGLVPVRTLDLETTVENMYLAGDSSGIEEATTAILEGRIAALSIASKLCDSSKAVKARETMENTLKFLWDEYRSSPLLLRARKGKEKATVTPEELEHLRRIHPPPVSFR
ncbi:MAG: FAD-dependent oxidoreductase [Desulfurococcaceae archaeon]